jgi:catechol-2,3-dioxygenase
LAPILVEAADHTHVVTNRWQSRERKRRRHEAKGRCKIWSAEREEESKGDGWAGERTLSSELKLSLLSVERSLGTGGGPLVARVS